MNVFIFFCVLLACFLPVDALTLTECQDGQLDIMNGTKTSITCTNIAHKHNIYWSINRLSTVETEMTIGTCMSCLNRTSPACNVSNTEGTDYTITRMKNGSADYSTVGFVANEEEHHNSIVKCSRLNNQSYVNCSINVIEVYKLSGCFVTENAQTPISCSYREPSHGMYWSITYPNGTVTRVAECAPCVNDTCSDCDVTNTDFNVTRDQNSSVIKMMNGSDVDKNGTKLQCSRFDNVTADDCMIRVFYYKLPQCEDGQLNVSEVEPWTTVNCEGLRQLQNMNWTITDHSGHVSQISFCDSMRNCYPISSNVTSSRNNTVSSLTFVGHVREKANLTLTCVKRDGGSQDSCQIRTLYPAETNNITVGVDSNLTVTGRVYIDKVYASDNNITCQWYHTLDNKTGDQPLTSLSLSTFTDTDGHEYQRGHCDMTWSVNSSEITHYFGVLIHPSNKSLQVDGVVTIEKPGQNLTTTCPDYVSEGSDLTCECSHLTAQHGNPPATISWINETGTAVLRVSNVSRQLNGIDYVCTSIWGAGMPEVQPSMNYTLRVAYGPENVTLNGSAYYITDDLQNVTLTCTWEEVYPSVNVTWSVPCENLTFSLDNSTCTIDTAVITNETAVTCTAVNTGIPQLNATDVFRFLFDEPEQNLTTTCPDYVSEGSDLTCECSHLAAQHGNPPATISWRNVTNTADLNVPNVSRDMNGTQFFCTSVWGEGRPEVVYYFHNYTMLVAYGPNNVTVYASGDDNADLQNVTLTCTYHVAYPSANFSWSVPCVAFTLASESSTCTIDKGMIDVREVACTAFNAKFPEINATRVHAFLFNDAVTSPPFPLVGVVVGVVAAVLLFIIIVVVVVVIVKRRASRKTHKGSSTRASNGCDVDEEKGSQLNKSKDQVPPSETEEHINELTVRHDQLQGSSKDATKQGQSTEMTHLNKDAKEATIKEREAKLKMLEKEKQDQEEQKRQKAEEKEAKKKQDAQEKEDKKREKAKGKEEKMAEKVREEEEKKKAKDREEEAKKKAKAEEEEREDAKKKEKERQEEDKKKEKAKEEEAKREEKAREEEVHRKEKARKEEEEKEKDEAKKKEKEREEEEKREKEKAREDEENRKVEEKRKAKAREDEEKEKKAREEEAKNRQKAAEKDAKQKQEALEKEERKAKTIEDEKRTDNSIAMKTQEAAATTEEREGKPHTPEEKEKKRIETPEEREARKQRKLKKLLEKIMQKIMQVFMERQGHTATDTDPKTLEKIREKEARKRQKTEEREARRKERLANKKETIEAQEEKEARREARKQRKVEEKEARRKERLARKEEEKTETEEETEARRQARRVKNEARKAREQEKKAREEARKARKQDRKARDQDRKARDQDEKAREHDRKPKDPAVKKDHTQHQGLTNTAKGVLQAGLGDDVGTDKTARPADTDGNPPTDTLPTGNLLVDIDPISLKFEEHINELYESADTLDEKAKNASPRNDGLSAHDEFEEHINDLYQSADDLDRPENSSKTKTTNSKSGAPDDEFEEHINDFYESADDLDVPEKSSKMNSPKTTSTSPDDEFEEHINDLYESADDLDNLGNPTKSRQSQRKVEPLADGKYAVDGSIYHVLESEEDTSGTVTVTDTDYESIAYDSDIYDSIGELDTTDDSSSDSYADSLDEEIYDYIDDIYESIDDVFDVNSSDITPDTKPGAKDGPDLPLFMKEKLATGTDALLAELKAVLHRAQKEGVAIPKKEPRPKEKAPQSQSKKEDMKSPCTNGGIQGTQSPSLKEGPNRLAHNDDGCVSVKAAKAFLDSQAHMYSQSEWAKKKGKPQENEWHTEKEHHDVENTTKGSVMKKTPPAVPLKPKGGNWKLNGQAQPDAPDEVYTDCLSQSKKVDALTALLGKPTSSPADKEVITQKQNAQNKPRRSDLYVSVAPLKQKPKAMTKSAKTGDDNTNGTAAGSKTQEVTKTAEPDDVYNELGSTRRRNQEADPIYNHLHQ